MGSKHPPGRSMPNAAFLALRSELLLATTMMSCEQTLDLADLLHTAIRMRKPGRPLQNLDHLFREEATSARGVELRVLNLDAYRPDGDEA
ncbi:hypothetical protein [Brevundimonas sp.]|jgi:hypothetical protein|uniref:hypothetical protein n=1 Tax=Brevundimonas sp. TaxID=1871086 RepID=UPI0037BE4BAE